MAEEILKIKVDSTEVDKGSASLDKLSTSSAKAEGSTDKLTSATALLGRAVSVAAGSYALFKTTQYIQEATKLSQRYQELGIAVEQMGRNVGISRTVMDDTAKSLQKLGISMIESRQTVLSLASASIDLANADKLADLARNAAIVGQTNTSHALNTMIHGIRSAQTEVMRTIGINVDFEKSYAILAKELGVATSSLSEQQRTQARMNVTLAEAHKFTGLYEQAMGNAGKQMRSTERIVEDLKVRVGGLFDETARLAATTYASILMSLGMEVERLTESGKLRAWGDAIARTFAFMGDAAMSVVAIFKIVGMTISATVAQFEAMARFDFAAVGNIQKALNADVKDQVGSMSTLRDALDKQIIVRDLLTVATKESSTATKLNTAENNNNVVAVEKAVKAKNQLTLAELRVQESTERTISLDRDVKRLTASVATEQEKYNAELAELNRLKPYLSVEIYERALAKLNTTTEKTTATTRRATDDISQLWMQAGRNIQSTLANSIFNFFDDGLKGMVKNFAIAIGRIMSELAALKVAQSIGLSGMFGAGAGGGGGAAINAASFGTGALGLLKTGFGATSVLGGIGGILPGKAGAFLGGMGGGTITGVSSPAALMGSSFAAAAGPAIAIFAADALARTLAGNKSFDSKFADTLQKIPVLGIGANIAAALFGHGPMKFRQQSLQGTAGAGGFEGDITNIFRAKGGLLVGNKHKSVTEQFSLEQQTLFDTTLKGFYGSAHSFAENLGLSTGLVDNFTKEVQIKSEKGKQLTEEAVAQMLDGIGNSLAQNVLPIVDTLRKAGEDSFDTLTRLNNEFITLTQGAENLGASMGYAKDLVSSMSFEARTAFVDAAGGLEALANKTSFFASNFLTDSERLGTAQEHLNKELTDLGLSAGLTKDEFKDLVQHNEKLRLKLLDLAPAFVAVRTAEEQLAATSLATAQQISEQTKQTAINNAQIAFATLQRSIDAEKTKLTNDYNEAVKLSDERIQSVTNSINELEGVSNLLKNSVNSISTMSLEQARSQAKFGNILSPNLKNAIDILSKSSTEGFTNVLDFKRSQAKNVQLLQSLDSVADDDLLLQKRSLSALEESRKALDDGFKAETLRLDSILSEAQKQLNILNKIDTSVLSVAEALHNFSMANERATIVQAQASQPAPVSAQTIRDFAATHTPMEIYNAAQQFGVSSAQIASSGAFTQTQINQFVRENKLASFDVGGTVPKTGIAMIHKDEQVLTVSDKNNIAKQLEEMRVVMETLTVSNNKVKRIFEKWDGQGIPSTRAA